MNKDDCSFLNRLRKPAGAVDVVIDTDTYNEIDDQFALAFLIKSPEKLTLKAVHAAPFFNRNSKSPADGMEKSYNEILNILTLMKREDLKGIVKRGSEKYLLSETEAIDSPAARNLVELAMGYTEAKPLYVIAIGAITNVASSILMEPAIINRMVLIWLGGHARHWPDTKEFNMYQDIAAARIIFGCGMAVVQLPCNGVVSSFRTTSPELEYWLRGKNALCDYLVEHTVKTAVRDSKINTWSRVIWDVAAVAWLLDGDFMQDSLETSPIPQYDYYYSFDPNRHFIRYVYNINRDELFKALFETLAA
jgi:inosine-uridine nucleoside N-ribohydrolase